MEQKDQKSGRPDKAEGTKRQDQKNEMTKVGQLKQKKQRGRMEVEGPESEGTETEGPTQYIYFMKTFL